MINYHKHKVVLAMMFEDLCTVTVTTSGVKDPVTYETITTKTKLYTDEPCRLSKVSADVTDGGMTNALTQRAKLFTGVGVDIPDSSEIEVVRQGKTFYYDKSALLMRYGSHNEYFIESTKAPL